MLVVKAFFLIADAFEGVQFFVPYYRLIPEGVAVRIASPEGETAVGLHGYHVEADTPIGEVDPTEYDLLVIPGGQSPERLRVREEAVAVARTFMDETHPVATIGQGPQLLISSGSLFNRQATSAPGIRDNLCAADATYHDKAVVRDGNLLTGRSSKDLPEFCRQMMTFLVAR
jgi:protease I